jgi:endonuclease/exonuclease/phosphatase family metal-dependent hydrolase
VLAGDLNEWLPWGRPLRWLDEVFGAQPGAPATFPSGRPVLALDHVRVRPPRRLLGVRVHATPLARAASDHLPLVADVASGDEAPT